MTLSHSTRLLLAGLALALLLPHAASASDDTSSQDEAKATYELRYKFSPDQELRWDVSLRTRYSVTFGGQTKTTESEDRSTKFWRVVEVDPEGNAVFEHMVEDVDMRHKLDGKEIHYNSKTDKKPPQGFAAAAERVGKPLTRITLNDRGRTVERTPLLPEANHEEKPLITIPLPDGPVAVGDSWSHRDEVLLKLENGATKTIKVQKHCTLKSVKTGVATIAVADQVITPIHSAAIEVKLIRRYAKGTVRFDIDAGRILSQRMDIDRRVIGFRGADSCVHYLSRFTERLLPQQPSVATRADKAERK